MSDRQAPPHNLEAERSVLGGVFIKPSAFDDVKVALEVDDFFLPAHREVFDAMLAVHARNRAMDVIGVADELRVRGMINRLDGGEVYLLTLSNSVPTAENIDHYVRLVKEKATLRRLIASCAEIQSRAHGDFGDFDEFLNEARTMVTRIDFHGGEMPSRIGDDLPGALDAIEDKQDNHGRHFVPTNLRAFDRKMTGYGREELNIVASRPGKGKSSWGLGVAIDAATAGVPNLFLSFEMPKQQLIERAISRSVGVEGRRLHKGTVTFDDWKLIQGHPGDEATGLKPKLGASAKLSPIPLYIWDRPSTVEATVAICRRWRNRVAPPQREANGQLFWPMVLITIDYLQIFSRMREEDEMSTVRFIENLTRTMKLLAKDLHCPIVLLSQLTRDNVKEDRDPMITDLRGSGSIEQDADMVLFTWPDPRPDPQYPGQPRDTWTPARLIVGKNREGAIGDIKCAYNWHTMTFFDHPDDDVQDRRFPAND